ARIAEVDADGIATVCAQDRHQPAIDLREHLVPAGGLERAAPADGRRAHPGGVGVELLERRRLRADESPAEGVAVVAPDAHHLAAAGAHLEAAGRLAEGTGPVARPLARAHGALPSLRYSSTVPWSTPLVATASPPSIVRRPRQSVKRPPASSTMGRSAAQSQMFIAGSSATSARPVATST